MNANDPTLKPRRHKPAHERPLGLPEKSSPFYPREALKRASTKAIEAEIKRRSRGQ